MAADGDALGIERSLDPEDYEVTFFVLYDPRSDLVFRVEAPYAFTKDPECRTKLTRQILHDVAREQGPPLAIGKADELAKIDRQGSEDSPAASSGLVTDREREYNASGGAPSIRLFGRWLPRRRRRCWRRGGRGRQRERHSRTPNGCGEVRWR